jgi:hypothetical protein
VPFWGAKASVPIDTPINQLKKGEFLWMGEAVTTVLWSWSSASLNSERMFIATGSDRGYDHQHRPSRSPDPYRGLHGPAKAKGASINDL